MPYAPGGGTDTGARMMAAGLERELNATFQVVNRAGAASLIGLTELTRAKPDGMTLAYAVLPTVVTHYRDPKRPGALHARELPADRDALQLDHDAVGARQTRRTARLRDFVEAGRAAPGKLTVSDSGLLRHAAHHDADAAGRERREVHARCISPAGSRP